MDGKEYWSWWQNWPIICLQKTSNFASLTLTPLISKGHSPLKLGFFDAFSYESDLNLDTVVLGGATHREVESGPAKINSRRIIPKLKICQDKDKEDNSLGASTINIIQVIILSSLYCALCSIWNAKGLLPKHWFSSGGLAASLSQQQINISETFISRL